MKVAVVYNFQKLPPAKNHKGGGIKRTIPDQAAPIRTILDRFTRGQSIPEENGSYTTYDLSEVLKMDKLERLEYLHNLRLQNREMAFDLENEIQQTPPLNEAPSQALGEKVISEKSDGRKTQSSD